MILIRCRLLVLLNSITATGVAYADRPVFPREATTYTQAYTVANTHLSKAYYLALLEPLKPAWFRFDGEAGEQVAVQIGLPLIRRLAGFRPQAVLLGPGLPPVEVPFPAPPGLGGILIDTRGKEPERFDEPVTQTSSWILAKESIPLAASGTHYLAVFAPEGERGKAWVSIGDREAFRIGDLLLLPFWIREVRAYHEVPGWPAWLVVVAAVAGAGAVWLIRRAAIALSS